MSLNGKPLLHSSNEIQMAIVFPSSNRKKIARIIMITATQIFESRVLLSDSLPFANWFARTTARLADVMAFNRDDSNFAVEK